MSTNFPTSLDNATTIPVESASTKLSVNHVTAHQNIQDAIEAIEAKLGIDGSAVTTSHDYKLSTITGSDKAVSVAGTQTVTNKSLGSGTKIVLGSDATGDIYYRHSDGTLKRLGIGSNGDQLVVSSGVPIWQAPAVTSNASTTVAGVVELATLAELLARTTTGGTGAKLAITPDIITTIQTYDYVADTGSSTAYAIAPTPAITAYVTGQRFSFKAGNTNTSTTPTINVSTIGAKTIINPDGTPLYIGQIVANGIYEVEYDGTNMHLVSASNEDYNSIPNTSGHAQTYQTFVVYPHDGIAGWTLSTTTKSIGANGVSLTANAVNYAKGAIAKIADAGAGLNAFTGMKMSYCFRNQVISAGTSPFDGSDIWYFHGISTSTTISSNGDVTGNTRRLGFAHYNGRIYTVTADGSAVTANNIQADSAAYRSFMIDWTASSVKFYINGVLVATHTTNISSDGTAHFYLFGGQDNASTGAGILISPITISTLYA